MLSVNQMFYGSDEPVWLVDGSTPEPVKYHYLGSAHKQMVSPPRRSRNTYYDDEMPISDRSRNSYYDDEMPISDRYYTSSRRVPHSSSMSKSMRPPSYYNTSSATALPFSSINPPPAPVVVPRETSITHTPVLPVMNTQGSVPMNSTTPYTLLLKVPICCEGCERRVVKKLLSVHGVMSVSCDIDLQRVTVRGNADTDEVLKVARKAFKKSRLW